MKKIIALCLSFLLLCACNQTEQEEKDPLLGQPAYVMEQEIVDMAFQGLGKLVSVPHEELDEYVIWLKSLTFSEVIGKEGDPVPPGTNGVAVHLTYADENTEEVFFGVQTHNGKQYKISHGDMPESYFALFEEPKEEQKESAVVMAPVEPSEDRQPPVCDIPAFEPVEGILSEMLYLENGIEYAISPEYWYEVSTWLENHAVAEVQDKPSASGERVKITFIDGTVRDFDLHSTMIDSVSYGLMRPGPKPEALKNPENGVSLFYKQPYEQAAKAVQQYVLARDVNLDQAVDLSQWVEEDARRLMETKIELCRWSHEQAAVKEENQRLTIYPCMLDKWREGDGITVYVQVVRSWNYIGHDMDSGSSEVMEVTVDKASGKVISCYGYGDKGCFGDFDIRYQMALEYGDDLEQLLSEFKQQYKGE